MDDLIGEFIEETLESFDEIDQELTQFKKNPNDQSALNSIFGLAHTIKATCGFLGFPYLESIAKALENTAENFLKNKSNVTQADADIIMEAVNDIKHRIDYLDEHEQELPKNNQDLVNRLQQSAASKTVKKPSQSRTELQDIVVSPQDYDSLLRIASDLMQTHHNLVQIASTKRDGELVAPIEQLSLHAEALKESLVKVGQNPVSQAWDVPHQSVQKSKETKPKSKQTKTSKHEKSKDKYLNFAINSDTEKAVSSSLVSEIGKINVGDIEVVGMNPAVKFKGKVVQLISLPGSEPLPDEGETDIIIIENKQYRVGLVVKSVLGEALLSDKEMTKVVSEGSLFADLVIEQVS